jgi:arylsulfatase A-like enzyme
MRIQVMRCFAVVGAVLAIAGVAREAQAQKHNVIIFVADGLRRGSVTKEEMPTFLKLRKMGVDFRNSHSVFPTFTTANASAIATGHGLGDTGDYSNVIYPGVWLENPGTADTGTIVPFLENDQVLADMNGVFAGNYLGERTLLSVAKERGFNVASVGKLGPTAIQQNELVMWNETGQVGVNGAIVVDDSTGAGNGVVLPDDVVEALEKEKMAPIAPTRTNGYGTTTQWNNAFTGDAATPGTLAANKVQEKWFADVTTKVLLPKFAAETKPFVLLFWSRDPDGSQHDEGDSLQRLTPGINGPTSDAGLKNADDCLKQLLDWLDAHPAIKAKTDVLVTSDHGFATISRREMASDGTMTGEPSAVMQYDTGGAKPEPAGTLPTGFLAVDLGIREHMRVFDSAKRATLGSSAYEELKIGGEKSQFPLQGNALLGDAVTRIDGSDAKLIVASNGGSDLVYVPSGDAAIVHQTIAALLELDYVGGIFVDDKYCPTAKECAGTLPLSAVGLVGASKVPRPAIAIAFRHFYQKAGDLQSGVQISDTTLQEGQGMHGGFGRDQTLNNMAAWGPDFKSGFVDEAPVGNMDLTPTIASILGIEMPSVGSLKGRVMREAMVGQSTAVGSGLKTMTSEATADGARTVMEYEEMSGVRYYDRACVATKDGAKSCW